jgi:hypothetical protein
MDCWTAGLQDCWIAGSLDRWISGPVERTLFLVEAGSSQVEGRNISKAGIPCLGSHGFVPLSFFRFLLACLGTV